nr:hypothetical protein [Tanacetum cinerariifolium]
KQIEDFIPIGSKEEGERIKRKGLRLEQDSAKKVKTSEEVSEEDLKTMMQLVPVEELWALVRETLNIRQAASDKEKELWVELKMLYEPDVKDQLWTHTQTLMHDPVEWRLYDNCGVHYVLSKDQEIFMLVEKDYPLRKGLAIIMISNKLHVENYSQMANDLILKIHQIANSTRQREEGERIKRKGLRLEQDSAKKVKTSEEVSEEDLKTMMQLVPVEEVYVEALQKLKRAKDAAYYREKMLLCKQEKVGIQLNEEQADWRDDTDDDELEDQELKAHYMYMAPLQEVSPDAADSGPIFDVKPLQKVSNDDHYNVFAIKSAQPKQSKYVLDTYPIEQDAHNVIIDSLDMSYDREEIDQNDDDNDLANEREIEDFKNKNKSLESSNNRFKEANNKLSETNNLQYTDFKKSQAELARRNSMEYALKMEIECAQKAQRANPRLYDIGCYNDNLALMLAPESDEVISLEKESRSKLSDLIIPFNYDKLNNLYDLFVPQREKSSEQRYFSERSRLSHTPVNNGNSKESFSKQTTLLKKRMDESIPWDQKCKSSIELFKIKRSVDTIIDGVERCK